MTKNMQDQKLKTYLIEKGVNELKEVFAEQAVTDVVVLGSGLSKFLSEKRYENCLRLPLKQFIPPFDEVETIQGQGNELLFTKIGERSVCFMTGRVHLYQLPEDPWKIALAIEIFLELGVMNTILCNAVGSVNFKYQPGDFIINSDFISKLNATPILDNQFVDLSEPFSKRLMKVAMHASDGIHVYNDAVCAVNPGPHFETPADIRALRNMGADTVGMSLALETIAHAAWKQRTGKISELLTISCIANLGAGMSADAIEHDNVVERLNKKSYVLEAWLKKMMAHLNE